VRVVLAITVYSSVYTGRDANATHADDRAMKFGVFYEHQLARPWDQDAEYRVLQQALEQCVLADRLGIDYVWEVEHHFLEEYSHSSAPEVFLAAVSQRTTRIRLGHGIVQMPPPFNHPARVAERIATLDLISDGRVEFGTGEASSEAELGAFLIDPAEKRAMWEEGLRVALRCLTEEPFAGHAGRYVTMPPRNVVPKPRQRPHPPVWVACSRRETIHLAAQHAIGALSFSFFDPEEARHWVNDYYSTLAREGVPIGDAVNANIACVTPFMCHLDESTAIARGVEGTNFLGYSLAHYYIFGRHRPGHTDVWAEYQQRRAATGYDPTTVAAAAASAERLGAKVVLDDASGLRGAVGTPAQIRDYFRRYEDYGVDQVIFASQAGRNRHEHVMESLELFGREVLPEFQEREARRAREKAERLAPVIDAVLARKPATDHPAHLADYEIPAIPRSTADREASEKFHRYLDDLADKMAAGEDVRRRLA
jgi:alkanesulfonate monooxygenase SsuD/methylene tetrahydromethanopterin reductase-like flavin-dependent oxidoreductase (luciferase family)